VGELLLEADLKPAFAAIADGFGYEVLFLLQSDVDGAAFGRIEHAECKRATILSHLISSEAGHRVQLGFAGLPETLGVYSKAMFAFQFAAENLKKHYLKCIEQLAILCQGEMRIRAAKVEHAPLVGPLGRNGQIKTQIAYQLGKELGRVFAGWVHIKSRNPKSVNETVAALLSHSFTFYLSTWSTA
jgi:hypothetical protein